MCPSFNEWDRRASGTSNGAAYDALEAAKALFHTPVEDAPADAARGCPPRQAAGQKVFAVNPAGGSGGVCLNAVLPTCLALLSAASVAWGGAPLPLRLGELVVFRPSVSNGDFSGRHDAEPHADRETPLELFGRVFGINTVDLYGV